MRKPTAALVMAWMFLAACPLVPEGIPLARYEVRLLQTSPPKLRVRARLNLDGTSLQMDRTRPADVPEVGERGWPALIGSLKVADARGDPRSVRSNGDAGWELQQPYRGPATLTYDVDYSVVSSSHWPAPREAAYADADHFLCVGRSLFVTATPNQRYEVTFKLPPGWHAVVPWTRSAERNGFRPDTAADLVENLVVLTRAQPELIHSGPFTVSAIPLGSWQAVSPQIRRLVNGVVPEYLRTFGESGPKAYSLVLLPEGDPGGESYRGSFALTAGGVPTADNMSDWGHTIAHEIFHYWNGWRLNGADYASTQWFQEGFTDYFADRAMLSGGMLSPQQFRHRLADYVARSRNLTTPMTKPGNHKGPPLYSAGALVAFAWDIQIRKATSNRSDLGTAMHSLWQATDQGARPYAWPDIRTALQATAPGDWQSFYQSYVDDRQSLPLAAIFREAGLKVENGKNGSVTVEEDANASAESKQLWQELTSYRANSHVPK